MTRILDRITREYAPEHDPPLGGYAFLLTAHLGLVGAVLSALDRRGAPLGQIGAGELLLTGAATYKLSRTITRSWIGTAVRAPFTRYVGQSEGDEIKEVGRGEGLQEAVGDLLTCPFCTGHWVATGLVLGHAVAPGPTRAMTRILTAGAISDVLQHVHGAVVRRTEQVPQASGAD